MHEKTTFSRLAGAVLIMFVIGAGCHRYESVNSPATVNNAPSSIGQNIAAMSNYGSKSDSQNLIKFEDSKLGITFIYPQRWGHLTTKLTCAPAERIAQGCRVDLMPPDRPSEVMTLRSRVFNAELYRFEAGGRSTDYTFGSEMGTSDITATLAGKNMRDICKLFHASTCEQLPNQVISMTVVPRYDDVCPPRPAQVAINKIAIIPTSVGNDIPYIMVAYNFLSAARFDELNEPISQHVDCANVSSNARATYNDAVDTLLRDLATRTLDVDSQIRSDEFDTFAASVSIKQ